MKYTEPVLEWIRFSKMDYDVARHMSTEFHPTPVEIVCYHCQQSAEKILKAYTIAKDEAIIKTHNLDILLNQCINYDPAFEILGVNCSRLTDYCTVSRYPFRKEITIDDMKKALSDSKEIFNFTKERLKELGHSLPILQPRSNTTAEPTL